MNKYLTEETNHARCFVDLTSSEAEEAAVVAAAIES